MKYNKMDMICMIIGVLAYTGTLLGDIIEINTSRHIVLATSAIIFFMFGIDGFRHSEE